MKPYSKILINDVYLNPVTNTEWLVIEKNDEEKLIYIVMLSNNINDNLFGIWKKNTDRIFGFPLVQKGC